MLDRIVPSRRFSFLAVAIPCIVLATGCTGDVLLRLTPKFGPVRVTGASGGTAAIVPRLNEELIVPIGVVPNPAARQIVAIDLASAAVSQIADIEGASAVDIISSATWVVWLDRAGGSLQVLDRTSNAKSSASDIDATDLGAMLRALSGDRVVVHRAVAGTADSINPQYELLVLNLRTGERITVADSWAAGTCALDGDWLALVNDKNVQVELLGLEFAANIDLVNLATAQRIRIASDLRISGSEPSVFIASGQVIWQEFKPGGFASRLRSYDIAAAKLSRLIDDFAAADEEKHLADVRDGRLLITRVRGNFLTPSAIAVMSQAIGGSDVKVLGQYDSLPAGWYLPEARLSDGFATWTEPVTGRLTAHEFAAGKTRTLKLP